MATTSSPYLPQCLEVTHFHTYVSFLFYLMDYKLTYVYFPYKIFLLTRVNQQHPPHKELC